VAILRRGVLPLLLVAGVAGVVASADAPNQAALVVVHGDGSVVTRCVAFAEPQISGLELLQRAGLDLNLEASGVGASICRLDGEGCTFPGQSCFCQCEGATCTYWSYWRWADGAWRYSQQGVANSSVLPGALEGWVWGAGTVERAQPPPAITFDAVCAPPTPVATVTSTAAPTFAPTETPTFMPTANGEASATSTATFTPAPTFIPATISMATAPPASPTPSLATLPPAPTFTPMATSSPPPAAAAPGSLVIELFTADHREIRVGESFTLAWRVIGADAVQLQAAGRTVTVAAAGALLLAPPQNTTYQLVATGAGGSVATSMTIIVRPRAPDESLPTAPATLPALPDTPPPSAAPLPTPIATAVLVVTAPPAATLSPTLAPVTLANSAQLAGAVPTATAAQLVAGGTLPVMLVGLLALAGVPLVVMAALLALSVFRRAL
jgi:hypothetical protein